MSVDLTRLGKIGLSLCGGGGRGIVQAGYLKAWAELGFDYQNLYGVSVGALNGSLLHQGDFDLIEKLWMDIRTKDVYRWSLLDIWRPFARWNSSLYNSKPLEKLIDRVLDYDRILSNPKSFYINASDFSNACNLSLEIHDLLDKPELVQFLKASASPPIFFPYVNFRGSNLCDGGVVSNYNLHTAANHGCDTIVLMSPTNITVEPFIDNIAEMLALVSTIPSYAFLDREMQAVDNTNRIIDTVNVSLEPDYRPIKKVLIRPPVPINISLLDFDYKRSRKELLNTGYQIAKDVLRREFEC